ncbi:MAG: c-type cytochrome [Gammaproteobacteria bacterium]
MSITFKYLYLSGCCALTLSSGCAINTRVGDVNDVPYSFGNLASAADIARIDIDVMPDGRGAPPGQGTYAQGKKIYAHMCAACHGHDMANPVKGTGASALRGGRGTLASGNPKKTVESYWPYASTLFDYTKRAMPFNAPGSMSNDEVYAVVAYILAEGGIINTDTVMDAKTIASVKMPNRDGFIPDPRPENFTNENTTTK